jgi:hypothetical protein
MPRCGFSDTKECRCRSSPTSWGGCGGLASAKLKSLECMDVPRYDHLDIFGQLIVERSLLTRGGAGSSELDKAGKKEDRGRVLEIAEARLAIAARLSPIVEPARARARCQPPHVQESRKRAQPCCSASHERIPESNVFSLSCCSCAISAIHWAGALAIVSFSRCSPDGSPSA